MENPLDAEGHPMHCWARTKQVKGRCRRPAGWGTDHIGVGRCKLHGGCVPAQRKKYMAELAHREALKLGLSIDISPHEALLANVRLHAGTVAFFNYQVSKIDPEELVTGGPGAAWFTLLQMSQKALTESAAAASRSGVEERRVRIAEQQAQLLIDVVKGTLADLGITETPETLQIVQRRLLQASTSVLTESSPFEHREARDPTLEEVVGEELAEEISKPDRKKRRKKTRRAKPPG